MNITTRQSSRTQELPHYCPGSNAGCLGSLLEFESGYISLKNSIYDIYLGNANVYSTFTNPVYLEESSCKTFQLELVLVHSTAWKSARKGAAVESTKISWTGRRRSQF